MSPAAFLDANVPMYAVGVPHPLKDPCRQILTLVGQHPQAFVTNVEVLQEIIHRYLAQRLWTQGREIFDEFYQLMRERIEAVQAEDVERAAALADAYPELAGRDLVHAAVMQRLGVTRIISADRGFDRLADIERLDPAQLESWRHYVLL